MLVPVILYSRYILMQKKRHKKYPLKIKPFSNNKLLFSTDSIISCPTRKALYMLLCFQELHH